MADSPNTTPMTEISRPIIEAEIDMLIDLLDRLDADPDLEEGADREADMADDEPLIGAPNQSAGSWKGFDASAGGDNGEELELGWTELEARFGRYAGAGDDVYEPSLGSSHSINQAHWSNGRTDDREEEFDGREADTDFEPWLAAQNPEWRYHYPFVANLFHRGRYPHLYSDVQTQRTSETSQLSWGVADSTDDREWDDEKEPEDDSEVETWGLPFGPCSPITTMVGSR